MPGRDDVKSLIRVLLKIDPVRSSILAGEVLSQRPFARFPDIEFPGLVERVGYYNVEKYECIKNWIEEYRKREEPLKIHEFFQRVFWRYLFQRKCHKMTFLKPKSLLTVPSLL